VAIAAGGTNGSITLAQVSACAMVLMLLMVGKGEGEEDGEQHVACLLSSQARAAAWGAGERL
jgi:hypothetical protein